jgi:hypothetical protein
VHFCFSVSSLSCVPPCDLNHLNSPHTFLKSSPSTFQSGFFLNFLTFFSYRCFIFVIFLFTILAAYCSSSWYSLSIVNSVFNRSFPFAAYLSSSLHAGFHRLPSLILKYIGANSEEKNSTLHGCAVKVCVSGAVWVHGLTNYLVTSN